MIPCIQSTAAPAAPADPALREIVAVLARAPLFAGLAGAELERIAGGCRSQLYERGNILFHKGDPCHGFHMVLSGQIKLAFLSADGNQKVIDILRPGQTFGEAVMFMDKPYPVLAEALVPSRVLHIGRDALFRELDHDPLFCRKLIAGLAQRLHHVIADLEGYSLRSGRERIIGYLLREEEEAGQPAASGPVTIRLPTHKATIASRLNLTQEHFSRILHSLVDDGLLAVDGRLVHIPDIGRLRASLP